MSSDIDSSALRRLTGSLPGLFLLLRPDPQFTVIAASQDYLAFSGTDTSICGQSVFGLFPAHPLHTGSNGMETLRAALERVLATRPGTKALPEKCEIPIAPAAGAQAGRCWSCTCTPVPTEQGDTEYVVLGIEEASKKASQQAAEILESITEGFFSLDRQWRFDYVNSEAHRILQRAPGDLSGKVLWQEYPGLEGTEFEVSYHKAMFQRQPASFTGFYPNQGRWYEVAAYPAAGGVSVYFRNVTASKQMEAEREQLIAESETQRRIYETALNSTPDFVYVFDLEHRAMYANEALVRTWGVDDVRGKKWMELGYEQWHADLHDSEIDRVIATRAPIRGEIPFTGTNGRRIYDYIFAPVLDAQGEVVAVAGTTRDVTERQAAEQAVREQALQLSEADRTKDEFLATLSHELRNPLAPLRNSIALLRMDAAGDAHTAPVLAVMERQVNHLVRLVDDLLEVSRISRGTLSLRKEHVELADIVRHAIETSDPQIQAAGHDLAVELPEDPIWLMGDPVRLAQIFANLLDNAAKYTADHGQIVLRARRDSGDALVSVTDNGCGITQEALPRMFNMFSRGGQDIGRSEGGLGIGLALSRRLAEMHDGTLEAHSEGIGRGSEFTVRLPLAGAQGSQVPAPLPAAEQTPLLRSRVLVVDDNHDAGDSLADVLEFLGADVSVVRSGAQALDVFASYQPTVVLLDIGMPDMNGYEVASAIRSRFPGSAATLVALTGWGQEDDLRRAREAGFDHHMVKPADIDALQRLLSSLEPAIS